MQEHFKKDSEKVLSKKERLKIKEKEKKVVMKYVVDEWLENYSEMKIKASTLHMPRLIPSYSDMPGQASGGFHSSTEASAMKKVTAEEWIALFHEKLEQLPPLHQELIERKYLKREWDGRSPLDSIVWEDMKIEKNLYYVRKKEALYWLGLLLKKTNQGEEK